MKMHESPARPESRSAFRLVQISDCHLPERPGTPYRGRNADAGIQSLLESVAAFRPHRVLLTGDLSEAAGDASYLRLADYLSGIGAPLCALPGNHDDDAIGMENVEMNWHDQFSASTDAGSGNSRREMREEACTWSSSRDGEYARAASVGTTTTACIDHARFCRPFAHAGSTSTTSIDRISSGSPR